MFLFIKITIFLILYISDAILLTGNTSTLKYNQIINDKSKSCILLL